MSRKPPVFNQSDIRRALKGSTAAGARPVRIEIDRNGKIALVFKDEENPKAPEEPSALDTWRANRGTR